MAVHACAAQLGFTIIEMNSSHLRSMAAVKKQCAEGDLHTKCMNTTLYFNLHLYDMIQTTSAHTKFCCKPQLSLVSLNYVTSYETDSVGWLTDAYCGMLIHSPKSIIEMEILPESVRNEQI